MHWVDSTSISSNTEDTDLSTGWHLCVIRVDRSGRMYISVNNNAYSSYVDISAKESDDLSNSQQLMLGENPSDLGGSYERYEGALDCVGIWNRLLTEEEEALLWNGGVGSEDFGLVVAPTITDQSSSITHSVGEAVSFYVTADGDPAPTYLWDKDEEDLSGETSASLSFTADINSGGVYNCTVTNIGGFVTSADIVLSIIPSIISQSSDTAALLGTEVTLSVTAGGYPTLSYQWYRNTAELTGETSASISVYATSSTIGTYTCLVTNDAGSILSGGIVLSILSNPYSYRLFDLPLDSDRVE